jgi:hypothetical protein
MADLITASRAAQTSVLASLSSSNPALLDSLITAASKAIQRHCHRDFTSTAYTEYLSGPNYPYNYIILRQCPVISIARLATNPQPVLLIQNSNSATISRAFVNTTATGLTLTSVSGTTGAATTTTLTYASYPVVNSMAAAIGAVSGWTASVIGNYGIYPTADLKPIQGAQTALFGGATLSIYVEDRYSYIGSMGGIGEDSEWDLSSTREQFRCDEEAGIIYGRFPAVNGTSAWTTPRATPRSPKTCSRRA